MPSPSTPPKSPPMPNGSGAAAILSAGIGCFVLAVLALVADKSAHLKSIFAFYKPTGALSGVTTSAILIWIFAWVLLEILWRNKTVAFKAIRFVAFLLLAFSFLLTFPPFADLF